MSLETDIVGQGSRARTDFTRQLDDTFIRSDDLLAQEQLFDGDLGLDTLGKLLKGVDDPVLAMQRHDGIVRESMTSSSVQRLPVATSHSPGHDINELAISDTTLSNDRRCWRDHRTHVDLCFPNDFDGRFGFLAGL